MTDPLSSDLASLRIDRDAPPERSLARRLLVPLLAIAGVGALAFFGYRKVEGQVFKQEVRSTEIAMISPAQAEVQVTATGYVIPQRTSKVAPKFAGRIAKVFVEEGSFVKEGDVVARLEDEDQRSLIATASSRVGVARSRIATARAQMADLTRQIERQKALVSGGAVGKATLDDLVAREQIVREEINTAEAELRAAQAEAGTVGVGLKDRVITAPISGRVVAKPATAGELVGSLGGPPYIAEIVDFDSMLVEADVAEARLHLVKIGGPAEIILDAYPNRRYRGVAKELGLSVNRMKATVMVKVSFVDDVDGVLPNMAARVSFLAKAITEEALKEKPKKVVAAAAVVDRDGRKALFAIDGGKLATHYVKVGSPVGAAVELLDGPPPGTKVVANPTEETHDGQRIKEAEK